MRLTITVVFLAICFNTVFGVLEYLLWKIISFLFARHRHYSLILRLLLHCAGIFLFAFLLYLAVCLYRVVGRNGIDFTVSYLSDVLIWPETAVCLIWLAGCLYMARRTHQYHCLLLQAGRAGKQEAPDCWKTIFEQEYSRMKLKQQVSIQKNMYSVRPQTICAKGKFMILLPHEAYTEREVQIIIRHELCHIAHHDFAKDRILQYMLIGNWFNPLVRRIAREAIFWMEVCRDVDVIAVGDTTLEAYFQCMDSCAQKRRYNYAGALFFAEGGRVYERKQMTAGYFSGRKASCWPLSAAVAVMLFAVGTAGIAAGVRNLIQKGFLYTYEMKVTNAEELPGQSAEVKERERSLLSVAYVSEISDRSLRMQDFCWKLSPGKAAVSSAFYLDEGDELIIGGLCIPHTDGIIVGLQYKESELYVENGDYLGGCFVIEEAGWYRLFACNEASGTVEVSVTFNVTGES